MWRQDGAVVWLILLLLLYGWIVVTASANAIGMMRPDGTKRTHEFEVMVPARNEAHNLPSLLGPLVQAGCRVTLFDDSSTDGTGNLAEELGAMVISESQGLPEGWTGKSRGCQALADSATADWAIFLDADTLPGDGFCSRLSSHLAALPPEVRVLTGFPKMLPGRGLEPGYLFWVPWILLATNPFALVARTGKGHNMFLNGQFSAWRRETLQELRPFEMVKGEVLEDVKIGRLLARHKITVQVADVSSILSVRMYEDLGGAVKGMSKNSADIAPGLLGALGLTLFLLMTAWGWLLAPPLSLLLLAALIFSGLAVNRVVKMPPWAPLLLPLSLTAAVITLWISIIKKGKGQREWKGRFY